MIKESSVNKIADLCKIYIEKLNISCGTSSNPYIGLEIVKHYATNLAHPTLRNHPYGDNAKNIVFELFKEIYKVDKSIKTTYHKDNINKELSDTLLSIVSKEAFDPTSISEEEYLGLLQQLDNHKTAFYLLVQNKLDTKQVTFKKIKDDEYILISIK